MTESKLKEYFEDLINTELLSIDLKDSQKRTGYDTIAVYVNPIADGKFEIKKEHLIKLCNDTINGQLLVSDLNTIAFALITSKCFYWDEQTEDGEIIETVIFDWDNPDIGYDLTIQNVELWRKYLITGNYKFNKQNLQRKRKS